MLPGAGMENGNSHAILVKSDNQLDVINSMIGAKYESFG
jgi:hypothetical protein